MLTDQAPLLTDRAGLRVAKVLRRSKGLIICEHDCVLLLCKHHTYLKLILGFHSLPGASTPFEKFSEIVYEIPWRSALSGIIWNLLGEQVFKLLRELFKKNCKKNTLLWNKKFNGCFFSVWTWSHFASLIRFTYCITLFQRRQFCQFCSFIPIRPSSVKTIIKLQLFEKI